MSARFLPPVTSLMLAAFILGTGVAQNTSILMAQASKDGDAARTSQASPGEAQAGQPPAGNATIEAVLSRIEATRVPFETALSPDGKTIAWVMARSGGGMEMDLTSLADPKTAHRLTGGPSCSEEDLAWTPDSKELVFASDCQGEFGLYTVDIEMSPFRSSTPRLVTRLEGEVSAPAFSPDGKWLGLLFVRGGTRRAGALDAMRPPAGVIGEDGVEVQRVAAVNMASGDLQEITPADLHVFEFDWSPDSKQLAYVAAPPPGENNWWIAKLYTQPAAEPAPHEVFDPAGGHVQGELAAGGDSSTLAGLQIAVPRWSPDGKTIAFIGGLMSDQGATGGEIYTIPATGGAPHLIPTGGNITVTWLDWMESSRLEFSYLSGGASGFAEIDPERSQSSMKVRFLVPATFGDGRLEQSISLARSGQAAFVESSFASPPEIWAGHPGEDEKGDQAKQETGLHPITRLNSAVQPAWGNAESIEWTSDNFHVQGWLVFPTNYDPGKKYPLIVSVHGGPSSAVQPRWPALNYNPAVFSALGYFVFMPNPRGSYGEGEAFTRANRRDFGHGDLRDILAGVDAVSAKYPIDVKRIGLTGWSYGGFMTMFAVTQTQRFRAAVAGAGISDWKSYYGENSIDQWMIPFFGASVYDDPEIYAASSAIDFVGKVRTPTLLVVGDRDGECPAPQSFEFWHALRAKQVPARLVVYPDEGHRFVSREHQRDVLERAFAWFEEYMPAGS